MLTVFWKRFDVLFTDLNELIYKNETLLYIWKKPVTFIIFT